MRWHTISAEHLERLIHTALDLGITSIFPIIGTTRPERMEEAANAMSVALDRQDWFELLKGVMGKEVP